MSIDNSLVLAAMVSHLPEKQQSLALKAGLLGAYLMRGLALAFVFVIIANPWIKLVGGAYLLYLMCSHLGVSGDEDEAKKIEAGFWGTVVAVEFADMSFSIDNIAAAAAFSNNIWIILTGVFIGILAMRFIAGYFVKLIEKFPVLASVAYLLVGWVGVQLWVEYLTHTEFSALAKFLSIIGIVISGFAYEMIPGLADALKPVTGVLGTVCYRAAQVAEAPFSLLKQAMASLPRNW